MVYLFNDTFQTLEHSLDYASAKNRVISNNIANIDTPHYKSKDVAFKNILAREIQEKKPMKKTHPHHFSVHGDNVKPYHMVTRNDTTYTHNGNNVDVDKEMSEMAKNQIYYQGLVDRLNGEFNNLQTVLRGGN